MAEKSLEDIVKDAVKATGVEKPVCYDLGCGFSKIGLPEFVGLDYYAKADDISFADLFASPWRVYDPYLTLEDNSVDVLYSSHFVEHIPDWNAFFTEAWRVLKPEGFFIIVTPYGTSNRATQDPDHKQYITEERYWYLSKEWRDLNKLSHYSAPVDFSIEGFMYDWHSDYRFKSDEAREFAKAHYRNVVNDMAVVLRAKK